jgi:type IV pilus assembly protein PilM
VFFGAKKVVGLDIGTSTVKMAELDVSRGSAQLLSFGFLPTPPGAVGGGDLANVQAIAELIKALGKQSKIKRKSACVGMWGTSVIVKKITMPRIEKKLISQQVRWEAEQYFPFDPNEISLAHHIIQTPGAPETMDILLVAAQNLMVTQYTQAVTAAGYKLDVLDVSGFALANTFELNYGKIPGQTIALLNIGAGVTNFVVVHDGEVIFSRDIPFGGGNYTMEIHKEMGVTLPEAEALKLSAVTGGEVPEQVHSIIKSVNELMVEEVRNSFEFFSASSAGFTISQCFFTGGSSTIPNLIPGASQIAGIPFEPINPFIKIRPARGMSNEYLQQIGPFASVVLGLALRKAGD